MASLIFHFFAVDSKRHRTAGKQNRTASAEYFHIPVDIVRHSLEDIWKQRGLAAAPGKRGRGCDLYIGSPIFCR